MADKQPVSVSLESTVTQAVMDVNTTCLDAERTLKERAVWYAEGCDGLEDVAEYFASGDCAGDAARDLDTALAVIASWRSAVGDLQGQLATLTAEVERLRLQLAACTTAALGNTPERVAERLQPDHPYYSASYGDVCQAVDREIAHRAEVERLTTDRDRRERQLFSGGVDVARNYGDNAFHLYGDQLERHFQRARTRIGGGEFSIQPQAEVERLRAALNKCESDTQVYEATAQKLRFEVERLRHENEALRKRVEVVPVTAVPVIAREERSAIDAPVSRAVAQTLWRVIGEMRSERPHYKSHDLGFVDSVAAHSVDDWADELVVCLARECNQCGAKASITWTSERCPSSPFGSCDGTMVLVLPAESGETQRQALQARTWQPIEDAPKDADALLLTDGVTVDVGGWLSAADQGAEPEEEFRILAGWWFLHTVDMKPTHYMLFPDPQATASAEPLIDRSTLQVARAAIVTLLETATGGVSWPSARIQAKQAIRQIEAALQPGTR